MSSHVFAGEREPIPLVLADAAGRKISSRIPGFARHLCFDAKRAATRFVSRAIQPMTEASSPIAVRLSGQDS
jgi:hypothetical protein